MRCPAHQIVGGLIVNKGNVSGLPSRWLHLYGNKRVISTQHSSWVRMLSFPLNAPPVSFRRIKTNQPQMCRPHFMRFSGIAIKAKSFATALWKTPSSSMILPHWGCRNLQVYQIFALLVAGVGNKEIIVAAFQIYVVGVAFNAWECQPLPRNGYDGHQICVQGQLLIGVPSSAHLRVE